MRSEDYQEIVATIMQGKIKEAEAKLAPFVAKGDLDGRYLAASISTNVEEDAYAFERRRLEELMKLSSEGHNKACIDVAWIFKHGDTVKPSEAKFLAYLALAALRGDPDARTQLENAVRAEIGHW